MNPEPTSRREADRCGGVAAPLRAVTAPVVAGRIARSAISPTRRQFLGWLALTPFVFAAGAMLQRLGLRHRPAPVMLPSDTPVGVTFVDDVVVNRDASGSVRAFAARCTHLGCRLQQVVDGLIVCSCHGSRFHPDGEVASGPANRRLDELLVRHDDASGGWRIDVG